MESSHELFIYGNTQLPCSVTDLEDDVFARIEGMGDVTGSDCGPAGWNLDIEFDSPNAFIAILHAVLQSLHDNKVDPQAVTVSARGRRHKLVDLL